MNAEVLPTLAEIESITSEINSAVPPTPQFSWPLLNERSGCELWVKHENHTAIGSFKIRGGVNYLARLVAREPSQRSVIAATRGNFGQAIGFAARQLRLHATIVVPHGNSTEKNRAMRALSVDLIEHGEDFQAALEHSQQLAVERRLHWVPSYHRDLVWGNAVSTLNFLRNTPILDCVYVPIGMGSGAVAMIAARDALGLSTKIVGVTSDQAPAFALSYETKKLTVHAATTRIADGMACSTPHPEALSALLQGLERIVRVNDDQIEAAMRAYFTDTHNVAEGAAAAGLAAVLRDRERIAGQRVGVVHTGGNVDMGTFARVLAASE